MNKTTFQNLYNDLKNHYEVYAIDLPGFGDEPIDKPLVLDDYVEFVRNFILSKKIDEPILIGHSFGGRVTIKYACKYEVNKIALVSTPGIKRRKLKVILKVATYKIFKGMSKVIKSPHLQSYLNNFGSDDYKNASPLLKETLVNIVGEDLKPYLKNIKASTLLIYGDKDDVTPYSIAKRMRRKIPDSGIVLIKNTGHFPYLDNPNYFNTVIKCFVGGKDE